jgi:hypothetical protein
VSPSEIKVGDKLYYRTLAERVTVVGGPQNALETVCFLVQPDGDVCKIPYLAPCAKLAKRKGQVKRAKYAKTPTPN